MTLSVERLNRAKKEIADIAVAFETSDPSNLSLEGHRLLGEMTALDDAEWDSLLAGLEDSNLYNYLDSLRRNIDERRESFPHFFSRIRQIHHTASFDVSQRSLTILLRFMVGEQSLVSRQDLEDTLWIGAAVVRVVSMAMREMADTLGIEAQRSCIGMNFEDNLKRAEDALEEIKRLHTAMRGEDPSDDEGLT